MDKTCGIAAAVLLLAGCDIEPAKHDRDVYERVFLTCIESMGQAERAGGYTVEQCRVTAREIARIRGGEHQTKESEDG